MPIPCAPPPAISSVLIVTTRAIEDATRSRARSGESRRDRTRSKAETWFAADGSRKSVTSGADRLTGRCDAAHVEPRDSLVADLDHRRQVIEGGGDELTDARGRFFVGKDEDSMRAQVLGLAQSHSRHDAEGQRLL